MDILPTGWWWGKWESASSKCQSGIPELEGGTQLTSPMWWRFQYLQNSSKIIVMCIPWRGAGTLPQGCTIVSSLFLPWSWHPLPYLTSNCWTSPLELRVDLGGWKKSEVAQSRLTLFDPVDYSLPGSSVHGIFQARVLEWVAVSFLSSRNEKHKKAPVPRSPAGCCLVSAWKRTGLWVEAGETRKERQVLQEPGDADLLPRLQGSRCIQDHPPSPGSLGPGPFLGARSLMISMITCSSL